MTVLLILSVGSLVGTNILDSVEAFRPKLRVVGINSEAEAPNNFCCDRVYLSPPAADRAGYWGRVQEVLDIEKPDVVMAGRDDDVEQMALWREQHPAWEHCLTVGSRSMAVPMVDKMAGYMWASKQGLPFAPTIAGDDPMAAKQCEDWIKELGCILIAKPKAGNGSRGVRLLLDQSALDATVGDANMVIQPYLADPGPYQQHRQNSAGVPLFWAPVLRQYVAQAVIGPDGAILGRFDMEAHLVAGRCERALRFDNAVFRAIGDRCAQAWADAGWRGIVNAQLIHHPKLGFQAIEFCARAAGGLMPRLLLGFDEMGLLLPAWTGLPFERSPVAEVAALALRVTRDVGLATSACSALREQGVWPSAQ